eukprot:3275152-Ditylum_brightwellii.AAC.1
MNQSHRSFLSDNAKRHEKYVELLSNYFQTYNIEEQKRNAADKPRVMYGLSNLSLLLNLSAIGKNAVPTICSVMLILQGCKI